MILRAGGVNRAGAKPGLGNRVPSKKPAKGEWVDIVPPPKENAGPVGGGAAAGRKPGIPGRKPAVPGGGAAGGAAKKAVIAADDDEKAGTSIYTPPHQAFARPVFFNRSITNE